VRVVERTQHGLLLVIAHELPLGIAVDELFVKLVAAGEATRLHPFGRLHGSGGLFRIREIERAEFTAEKTRGGEGLKFFAFAHTFEALANIDKGRDHRIARSEHLRHPRADVGSGNGLRRHVTGVPVILVTRMQDAAEVRLDM
jgi:hypothetical protein